MRVRDFGAVCVGVDVVESVVVDDVGVVDEVEGIAESGAGRVIVVVTWRTVVEPQPAAASAATISESTSGRRDTFSW